MQRISTDTAVADLYGAGKKGFTDGDEPSGIKPTQLDATWHNAIQEEIANVIEGAGAALDSASRTQLYEAILSLFSTLCLKKSNNLSDLGSLATALTNLGFGGDGLTRFKIPDPNDPTKPWVVLLGTGTVPNSGATVSHVAVTFPTAFVNMAPKVFGVAKGPINSAPGAWPAFSAVSTTLVGFTAYLDGLSYATNYNQTVDFDYIAIGK